MNLYGFAGGDPVNFSDPMGLCPKDAGGDGKAEGNTDCPKGSSGYYANEAASGRGGIMNDIKGAWATLNFDARAQLPENTVLMEFNLPVGPGGGGLAKGMAKAVERAQGAEVAFSKLDQFTRAAWQLAGDKGAGYVKWNRILDREGSTIRLFKDVYGRGGEYLRRDWYVGGPPR